MAAREAETHANEAAQRRAWREAPPTRQVIHSIGVRLAEPPRSVRLVAEQAGEASNQPETMRSAENDFVDTRLKEIEERERALADRERLIETLEGLLDHSRRRLEERLAQFDQRIATLTSSRV